MNPSLLREHLRQLEARLKGPTIRSPPLRLSTTPITLQRRRSADIDAAIAADSEIEILYSTYLSDWEKIKPMVHGYVEPAKACLSPDEFYDRQSLLKEARETVSKAKEAVGIPYSVSINEERMNVLFLHFQI